MGDGSGIARPSASMALEAPMAHCSSATMGSSATTTVFGTQHCELSLPRPLFLFASPSRRHSSLLLAHHQSRHVEVSLASLSSPRYPLRPPTPPTSAFACPRALPSFLPVHAESRQSRRTRNQLRSSRYAANQTFLLRALTRLRNSEYAVASPAVRSRAATHCIQYHLLPLIATGSWYARKPSSHIGHTKIAFERRG